MADVPLPDRKRAATGAAARTAATATDKLADSDEVLRLEHRRRDLARRRQIARQFVQRGRRGD